MHQIRWKTGIVLCSLLICCWSCAGPQQKPSSPTEKRVNLAEQLDHAECPSLNDLRGAGISRDAAGALAEARSQIALQITAKISSQTESGKHQQILNGNEKLHSWWTSEIQQTTHLINGEEARPIATVRENNQVGIVACMSRAAAVSPMRRELLILSDSLTMFLQTEQVKEHPLQKENARKTAEALYIRYLAVRHSIQSLSENTDTRDSLDAAYEKMVADYDRFRSRYAFFWAIPEKDNPEKSIIFARLSSRYKMESGECTEGLRLYMEAGNPACKGTSLGIECAYAPALRGQSCKGENYFLLQAPVIRGIGRYDEKEALQKLFEKMKADSFWNTWFVELDKWRIE